MQKFIHVIIITAVVNLVNLKAVCQAFTYKYDKARRLIEIDYSDNLKIIYKYDKDGNRISIANLLPVRLLSFMAVKQKNKVLLTWEVTQEINFAKYDVQFSLNGVSFQTFTSVMAKGSSSNTDYNTIHCCPIVGDNYYRLKMIDRDGKFTYSEIRKITFDAENIFKIYPNPISNSASLTITLDRPLIENAAVYVYSTTGSKVVTTTFIEGLAIYDLKLPALVAGTYFIIINTKAKMYQSKFIKQ